MMDWVIILGKGFWDILICKYKIDSFGCKIACFWYNYMQVRVGWFQDYKNTELYFYDEGSDCMYNFINDDIKLDFEIPGGLQYLIDEAEKADKENDLGTYIAYADVIDTAAKNYCAAGKITMKDWDKVCARYEQ